MKSQRAEILVGAFVLGAFAILFWASMQLGGWSAGGGRRMIARFEDVAGLRERAAVLVAGVPVGRVERLALDGRVARVTLRIEDSALRIPVDTIVAVRSRGFLGDKVVDLSPGESAELIEDGGVITRTRNAPDVDRFVDRLSSIADDVQSVSATFRNVVGTAEGEDSLRQVLANAREISSDLRRAVEENEARLERTIVSFETFSADLAELTQGSREPIEALIADLRHASRSLSGSLDTLAEVFARVERGEGTLGRIVSDEKLYADIDAALAETRAALREVRRAAEETQEQVPATILTTLLGSLF